MRLPILLGVLLTSWCSFASGLGTDSTLSEARLLLLDRDRQGAADMYAFWLEANPASAQAPVIFEQYFSLEQNLASLLDAGSRLLKTAQRGLLLSTTMVKVARLFEVAGRTEEAREGYLSAYARGETASALEAAFLISLEMNDIAAMQTALSKMLDTTSERQKLLDACLGFQKGDVGPADEALRGIADTANDQTVALRALWMSYTAAMRTGNLAARREVASLLQARFPRSPECAIAVSDAATAGQISPPGITLLALPGNLLIDQAAGNPPSLSPSAAPEAVTTPEQGTPSVSLQRTFSVQSGSFQMKENADDLISELTRKGFAPSLRVEAFQGKPLYRVLAGNRLSEDEATALASRLRVSGFSAFMLSDQ
jgi:cell division septation protein DedD